MCNLRVVVIPHPAKGHVVPLMELSHCLANHGIKVTFVDIVFSSNSNQGGDTSRKGDGDGVQTRVIPIKIASEICANSRGPGKLTDAIFQSMPRKLEELIEELNGSGGDKIACVVADVTHGWALEVAAKLRIRRAVFFPSAAAIWAQQLSIPKLLDDGVINSDGTQSGNQLFKLSPTMPAMRVEDLFWLQCGDQNMHKTVFKLIVKNNTVLKLADKLICNSVYEIEAATFTLFPEIQPIGPLLKSNRRGGTEEGFQPEDSKCLEWLEQQPPCSVIYAAFGSLTTFNQIQFNELARGLECLDKPILWVVRADSVDMTMKENLESSRNRLASRGHIVSCAPQQEILGHPSVACFMSHCGWNSIMEGISNGVPFLSWPYTGDQFFIERYVCDVWKVGLTLSQDQNGIVTHEEIKNKVDQLLRDENFKTRAVALMNMAKTSVEEGGSSYVNFKNFVEWIEA